MAAFAGANLEGADVAGAVSAGADLTSAWLAGPRSDDAATPSQARNLGRVRPE